MTAFTAFCEKYVIQLLSLNLRDGTWFRGLLQCNSYDDLVKCVVHLLFDVQCPVLSCFIARAGRFMLESC